MAKEIKENKIIFGDIKEFPEKDAQVEPKSKKQKTAENQESGRYLRFIKDERFLKSVGIFFTFLSVFLFVS